MHRLASVDGHHDVIRGLERDRLEEMDRLHSDTPLPGPHPVLRLTFDPESGGFRPDDTAPEAGESS